MLSQHFSKIFFTHVRWKRTASGKGSLGGRCNSEVQLILRGHQPSSRDAGNRRRADGERGPETILVPAGLPSPGHGSVGRWLSRRESTRARSKRKLSLVLQRARAAGPGGIIHLAPFHPSQEKHSRLIILEFLNTRKAVML